MSAAITNPYVSCPYDKSHAVPKLRLQRHLMKCRKNHAELAALLKTCPFNACHIMPEQELQSHYIFCKDKNLIEGQKYNNNVTVHGNLGNPEFHLPVPIEDWADDDDNEEEAIDRIYGRRNPVPVSSNRSEFLPGGALGAPIHLKDEDYEQPIMTRFGMGRGRPCGRQHDSD